MKIPWEVLKKNINARIYLIFGFAQSLWFIEAIWYFYWSKFLTYTQIGYVFSYLVVVGLLAEIPTGYFADKYGRKTSVVLGMILQTAGAIFMTTALSALQLIVGLTLMSIGRAFVSGSIEAIVYDSLKAVQQESHWDKLVATKIQFSLLAYIVAVPIGGFVYDVYFRLPNILEALTLGISIFIAMSLRDKYELVQTDKKMIGFHLKEMLIGFKELWSVKLKPFIIPAFMIITVFQLYDWGLSKPAMAFNFGLKNKELALVYTGMAIFNIFTVSYMPKIRKMLGDYWGLRILNILSGVAFVASTYMFNLWGIATMFLLETAGHLGDPWTSSVVNEHIDSRHRATTLSTLAFMTTLPHFFVNILAGTAIDGAGINSFHLGLGIVILLTTILTAWPGITKIRDKNN
jgi:MFS family permease